mmetsp:Transcript_91938/g.286594  ORF Transcript_91938/g.286594 Transcript_91938/m.286594 type:complete len:82 (-) Transcript_91938:184-429(-)
MSSALDAQASRKAAAPSFAPPPRLKEGERCSCCSDRGTVDLLEGSCPLCDGLGLAGVVAQEERAATERLLARGRKDGRRAS